MNFGSDSYLRMFGSEAPGCDQIVGTADRVVHKKTLSNTDKADFTGNEISGGVSYKNSTLY